MKQQPTYRQRQWLIRLRDDGPNMPMGEDEVDAANECLEQGWARPDPQVMIGDEITPAGRKAIGDD